MDDLFTTPTAESVRERSPDWFAFRKRHPAIYIANTGEDGNARDWQELLKQEGSAKLSSAIGIVKKTLRQGYKVRYADVLEAISVDPGQDDGQKASGQAKAAIESRNDVLLWCLCISAELYANTRCHGRVRNDLGRIDRVIHHNGECLTYKVIPCEKWGTPEQREQVLNNAKEARIIILDQTDTPDDKRHATRLYEAVKKDKRLMRWLKDQRILQSTRETE